MNRETKLILGYIAISLICIAAGAITMNLLWFMLQLLATVVFIVAVVIGKKSAAKESAETDKVNPSNHEAEG